MAKVLLVEDDNNLREIFEMRLQAEGYQTVTAANGEEGLVVAMKEKPDLVIADVMMPKLSGFEMVETLKASPEMKDVKIIMMTALGEAEDRTRGENLGAMKYLVKSQVTLEDFARTVKEVLEPGSGAAAVPDSDSSTNNKQESENKMPEDTTNVNPMPASDPAAPAPTSDTPPVGPASSDPVVPPADAAPAADSTQSSAQEQSVVNDQINSFVASAPAGDPAASPASDPMVVTPSEPAAPAADSTSTDATSIPVATPPAEEAPAAPAADTSAPASDAGAAPSDPAANSL
jgi:CheY-like chemotaxis protein